MALDSALYTLHFVPRRQHPWIVDLYQANLAASSAPGPPVPSKDRNDDDDNKPKPFSGTIPDRPSQRDSDAIDYSKLTPVYTRQRATHSARYSSILLDGILSDCLLASVTAPSTAAKTKTVQLHHPECAVALEKRSKTFHQDWRFRVEHELFSWRRESASWGSCAYTCEVIRKPDPSVLVAQYRPASRARPARLQLMDYNLDRLDVQDKRGLEVALVMTLCALLDQEHDERLAQSGEPNVYVSREAMAADGEGVATGSINGLGAAGGAASSSSIGPSPLAAVAGGADEPGVRLEPNEVLITPWGTTEDYVDHCLDLLRTDDVPGKGKGRGMYMIVLRSDSAETTPKTIQVAAAVKAAYYRLPDEAKGTVYGNSSRQAQIEDELYQYVKTEDEADPKPDTSTDAGASSVSTVPTPTPKRRIIKLDPPSSASGSRPGSSSPSAAASSNATPTLQSTHPTTATGPASSGASKVARASFFRPPPSKLRVFLSKERIGELEPPKKPEPFDPSLAARFSEPGSRTGPEWRGGGEVEPPVVAPRPPTRPAAPAVQAQPTDYGRLGGTRNDGGEAGASASTGAGGRRHGLLGKLGLGG